MRYLRLRQRHWAVLPFCLSPSARSSVTVFCCSTFAYFSLPGKFKSDVFVYAHATLASFKNSERKRNIPDASADYACAHTLFDGALGQRWALSK
jgi:hypothetical protein